MVNRLVTLGKEAGFRGLFAGLGPRMSEYISIYTRSVPITLASAYLDFDWTDLVLFEMGRELTGQ